MEYSSRLKGGITQTLIKSMLTDAGYKVVPLGVEEVIREVTTLDHVKYKQLNLPEVLRKMPDFFVSDSESTKCWLVEVKYRKKWEPTVKKKLGEALKNQARLWGSIYVIILLGTPVDGKRNDMPFAWVGVAKVFVESEQLKVHTSDGESILWDKLQWKQGQMQRIQDVFEVLNTPTKWDESIVMKTLSINKMLIDIGILN